MKADIKAKQETQVLAKPAPFSAEDRKKKHPKELALPASMLDP